MRTKGYKCYNIKCDSCIGKTLCGEPADTALSCTSRVVNSPTNADHIRAMSDEELARIRYGGDIAHCKAEEPIYCKKEKWVNGLSPCEQCYLDWLKQPYKEDT